MENGTGTRPTSGPATRPPPQPPPGSPLSKHSQGEGGWVGAPVHSDRHSHAGALCSYRVPDSPKHVSVPALHSPEDWRGMAMMALSLLM